MIDGNHLLFSQEGVLPAGAHARDRHTRRHTTTATSRFSMARPRELIDRFRELLLGMSYADPAVRPLLDMEGLKQWRPGRTEGYAALDKAVDRFGTFDGTFVTAGRGAHAGRPGRSRLRRGRRAAGQARPARRRTGRARFRSRGPRRTWNCICAPGAASKDMDSSRLGAGSAPGRDHWRPRTPLRAGRARSAPARGSVRDPMRSPTTRRSAGDSPPAALWSRRARPEFAFTLAERSKSGPGCGPDLRAGGRRAVGPRRPRFRGALSSICPPKSKMRWFRS